MEENKDVIVEVNVEDILPNRFQPRLAFDDNELNELSNSIRKYGVIQPILLRKIGEKYEIVAGERRYKATVLAGLKTIPAIIKSTDDNTSAEIALLENLQRKNLTVIEEAQSFKKLLDRGFTQEEIASKMGISQSSIANKLRLLNLPSKVQDALLFNKISERHARSLLSLNNKEEQENLLQRIISERLTVRQTEEEISKLLNNFKVEDDIPFEIRKYLDRKDNDIKEEVDEEKPEVVNIEEKEDYHESINPFQNTFQDRIKEIESEIDNKEDSFYEDIINNSMTNNQYDFLNNSNFLKNTKYNEESHEEVKSIPEVISKVRSFVKEFDEASIIETKETDLPDKYQIIIEIKKEQ